MYAGDTRLRIRQDTWQFATCLSVLCNIKRTLTKKTDSQSEKSRNMEKTELYEENNNNLPNFHKNEITPKFVNEDKFFDSQTMKNGFCTAEEEFHSCRSYDEREKSTKAPEAANLSSKIEIVDKNFFLAFKPKKNETFTKKIERLDCHLFVTNFSKERVLRNMPKAARALLDDMKNFVHKTIEGRRTVINDIETRVRVNYPLVRARIYRSTTNGDCSLENEVDIYLDCHEMWHGRIPSAKQILYFMTSVRNSLLQSDDSKSWEFARILERFRSQQFPIIEARHAVTGLTCGIYCDSDTGNYNTELIKSFNYIFPSYRKLLILARRWLEICELSGSERITNYALYWHVIFFLQTESILPSINELIIIRESNSDPVYGWDLSASFTRYDKEISLESLIVRFFEFYANFDYHRDVACPLIGKIVKKCDFVNFHDLPEVMRSHVKREKKNTRVRNNNNRYDGLNYMCFQDPFDVEKNLTKNVKKHDVNRFQAYCSESLVAIRSS